MTVTIYFSIIVNQFFDGSEDRQGQVIKITRPELFSTYWEDNLSDK